MKKTFTVIGEHGLHARPAANFVRCTSSIPVGVVISFNNITVDAKSIMGVISLRAVKGSEFTIEVDSDNPQHMDKIESHLIDNQII